MIKEESDGKEDSDHSLNSEDEETGTDSESKMAKNKGLAHCYPFFYFTSLELSLCDCFIYIDTEILPGKKKKKVVESSDSDYAEEFGRLDLEEDSSSSDSSYAPDSEEDTHVKRKVTSPKKKGKNYIDTTLIILYNG